MGRCYEFGVSIADGCEHAMVVPPEGGRCECSGCGASCLGQFRACVDVISIGGYVPIAAPEWAKPASPGARAGASSRPPARRTRARSPERRTAAQVQVVDDVHDDADVRAMVLQLIERPDRSAEAATAVEVLRTEMAHRDGELAEAFDRLTTAYDRLAKEVAADRAIREDLARTVVRLSELVPNTRGAFGFGKRGGRSGQ